MTGLALNPATAVERKQRPNLSLSVANQILDLSRIAKRRDMNLDRPVADGARQFQ
jgi:hypothetical protein